MELRAQVEIIFQTYIGFTQCVIFIGELLNGTKETSMKRWATFRVHGFSVSLLVAKVGSICVTITENLICNKNHHLIIVCYPFLSVSTLKTNFFLMKMYRYLYGNMDNCDTFIMCFNMGLIFQFWCLYLDGGVIEGCTE